MIDFHNHILPNVDDGSKSIEETMGMVRFASNVGITEIVQTVHFQHPKMESKNTDYDYLINKIKKLQYKIDNEGLKIKLHLSAEVFYLPNLVDISSNPLVTVGNGKYMLIEFTPNIFPKNYEEEFYKLQLKGITPIIAHPERYRFIQNDVSILKKWIDRGFVIQLDAGSLLGHFGEKNRDFTMKIVNMGFFHLIGSDAHNNKKRNFCLHEAYLTLEKYFSIDLINILKINVKKIIEGKVVEDVSLLMPKLTHRQSSLSYLKEKIKKIIKF